VIVTSGPLALSFWRVKTDPGESLKLATIP